jgi:hypothetical protein
VIPDSIYTSQVSESAEIAALPLPIETGWTFLPAFIGHIMLSDDGSVLRCQRPHCYRGPGMTRAVLGLLAVYKSHGAKLQRGPNPAPQSMCEHCWCAAWNAADSSPQFRRKTAPRTAAIAARASGAMRALAIAKLVEAGVLPATFVDGWVFGQDYDI